MTTSLVITNAEEAVVSLWPVVVRIADEEIIPIASGREASRTGGWFTCWRSDGIEAGFLPLVGFPVGNVSAADYMRYDYFAMEKPYRLSSFPSHVSSWQSRDISDPDRRNQKYGGAIRCADRRLIFSVSGFSEHEDEALCTMVARHLDLLTDDEYASIANVSDNPLLKQAVADAFQP